MTNQTLEERNKEIRDRMLDVSKIQIGPFTPDSPWLKPFRMTFMQDGKPRVWDLMKSCESVSIVVFNISRKKLIFVRQFRPAAYLACLPPDCLSEIDIEKYPPSLGLTIELCAGAREKNRSLIETAQDELLEECGYQAPLSAFQKVVTYRFIASTVTTQTLFYVEVTDEMNTHPGGGAEEEGELIEIVEMSIDEVQKYVNSESRLCPLSLYNGVSWFLMNKKDRYEE